MKTPQLLSVEVRFVVRHDEVLERELVERAEAVLRVIIGEPEVGRTHDRIIERCRDKSGLDIYDGITERVRHDEVKIGLYPRPEYPKKAGA